MIVPTGCQLWNGPKSPEVIRVRLRFSEYFLNTTQDNKRFSIYPYYPRFLRSTCKISLRAHVSPVSSPRPSFLQRYEVLGYLLARFGVHESSAIMIDYVHAGEPARKRLRTSHAVSVNCLAYSASLG